MVAALLISTSIAHAKPARPLPPQELTVDPQSDARVTALILSSRSTLRACAGRKRIEAVVHTSFDRRGRARRVVVRSRGGASFDRCAVAALRRAPPSQVGASPRRSARFVIAAISPTTPITLPAPADPSTADLRSCTVDADCTIHFRRDACFPGDPIAVNRLDPAAVRQAFPVERLDCAMGGPQYERERLANDGRYTAACQARRCTVIDRGPRDVFPPR